MLLPRILTALVLVSALVALLLFTTVDLFTCVISIVVTLAFWEWSNLAGLKYLFQRVTYVAIGLLCFVDILAVLDYLPFIEFSDVSQSVLAYIKLDTSIELIYKLLSTVVVVWGFIFIWVVSYPKSLSIWRAVWVRLLLGILVLIPFALSLIYLFRLVEGVHILMYLIALIAVADVGAYFFGRLFGKHKLLEPVSPGKTWEGFFGGLLLSSSFCLLILNLGFNFQLTSVQFISVSLLVSLVSVLGDLFESMLKRHRGIKDSSNILPGHGGILDRIDSHVVGIPFFCLLYLSWI